MFEGSGKKFVFCPNTICICQQRANTTPTLERVFFSCDIKPRNVIDIIMKHGFDISLQYLLLTTSSVCLQLHPSFKGSLERQELIAVYTSLQQVCDTQQLIDMKGFGIFSNHNNFIAQKILPDNAVEIQQFVFNSFAQSMYPGFTVFNVVHLIYSVRIPKLYLMLQNYRVSRCSKIFRPLSYIDGILWFYLN